MKTNKLIYFDNSASSGVKPQSVIEAVSDTMKFLSANPGRSGHPLSVNAAALVYNTRKKAAQFFGLDSAERVIFCSSCTDALNTAILGIFMASAFYPDIKPQKTGVITTSMEHNSVLRPLFMLKRKGYIDLTVIDPNEQGIVTAQMIEQRLNDNTAMIAVTHVSNVTGAVNPIAQIGALAKKHGALLLCDCAQSAGYFDIDMGKMGIDILTVAGHKGLRAPQGIGLLLCSSAVTPYPTRFGGTGTESHNIYQPTDLPESLESGTLSTPLIAGLNSGMDYCTQNRGQIRAVLAALTDAAFDQISKIPNIVVYSPKNTASGVITFNIEGMDSVQTASILSEEYGICVRSGLHCAPLIHKHLGTLNSGAVRVSLSSDNSYQQLQFLVEALNEIASL